MKNVCVFIALLVAFNAAAAIDVDLPINTGVGTTNFSATLDGPGSAGAWNVNIPAGTNYIEEYLFFDDGTQPNTTFSDIIGMSMYSKDADVSDIYRPYVQIYTKKTGLGDVSWYHQIYTADIANTTNGVWELWNATGFYEGQYYSAGSTWLTLAEMASSINEEILAIKFQLGDTGPDNFPFAGSVSEPTIDFSAGTLGTVNYHLVPEPATMCLMALGGLLLRRKK